VSYVPDGAVKIRPNFLFPGVSEIDPVYLDRNGCLTISSGGLLVQRDGRTVLIDAGYGPHPEPVTMQEYGIAAMYGGALTDNLAALGASLDTVESIAVTHLHVEHVGWLDHTSAPCLITAREWAGRDTSPGVTQQTLDAIAPRVRTVADGDEVLPGVHVVALPGHTPGQFGFTVTGDHSRLLAFADVMHSPLQVQNPDWAVLGEPDPAASGTTRRRVLEDLAEEGTIGFGIHFADVPFGTVRNGQWVPYDEE